MIRDIVLGGLIIFAGLLIIIFAELIGDWRRDLGLPGGTNFCRLGGVVMILIGLRVICFGI